MSRPAKRDRRSAHHALRERAQGRGSHPNLSVTNMSSSQEDQLAVAAIADVSAFWSKQFPLHFGQSSNRWRSCCRTTPRRRHGGVRGEHLRGRHERLLSGRGPGGVGSWNVAAAAKATVRADGRRDRARRRIPVTRCSTGSANRPASTQRDLDDRQGTAGRLLHGRVLPVDRGSAKYFKCRRPRTQPE